jgi:hypothetical protein
MAADVAAGPPPREPDLSADEYSVLSVVQRLAAADERHLRRVQSHLRFVRAGRWLACWNILQEALGLDADAAAGPEPAPQMPLDHAMSATLDCLQFLLDSDPHMLRDLQSFLEQTKWPLWDIMHDIIWEVLVHIPESSDISVGSADDIMPADLP